MESDFFPFNIILSRNRSVITGGTNLGVEYVSSVRDGIILLRRDGVFRLCQIYKYLQCATYQKSQLVNVEHSRV